MCLYSIDFKKALGTVPCDKLWENLQRLCVPLRLQQTIKAIYTTIYAKVRTNNDTHGEVMSDTSKKKKCFFPPMLSYSACTLCIDELETYLDEIEGDCPCLFNIVVVILLHIYSLCCSTLQMMSKPIETFEQAQ